MTPPALAQRLVSQLDVAPGAVVMEPSFGRGSFLLPLIERLVEGRSGSTRARFEEVMIEQVFGVELDPDFYRQAVEAIEARWGVLPEGHNLRLGDYFRFSPQPFAPGFDLIVGNPPFGGTFDSEIEDSLDRKFGNYNGHKLKKETYSFFVAKGIEELAAGGRMRLICSDTFLTIKTMRGLRELLLDSGQVVIEDVPEAFDETKQPMIVLDLARGSAAKAATIRGESVPRKAMELTKNLSWGVRREHLRYFDGATLGDLVVATGGMTIGRNEWFVRQIESDGTIEEPYEFEFFDRSITLEGEIERARLNRLSPRSRERAIEAEARGDVRRAVRAVPRAQPIRIEIPHPDYRPYNKASSSSLYGEPTHVVYWKDDGDAVLTFKRDGPWYLHGVGGKPYFGREGITWQLVAATINARYLPPGFILDSGAPCAFLRDGVPRFELFLILGWLQTDLATNLLKTVINHTRNIQGKDIERLPYPHWLSVSARREIAVLVERSLTEAMNGHHVGQGLRVRLNEMLTLAGQARAA
jgi:Eco57I restriction-modification methylase